MLYLLEHEQCKILVMIGWPVGIWIKVHDRISALLSISGSVEIRTAHVLWLYYWIALKVNYLDCRSELGSFIVILTVY
jgi:hypothetical protein